jgi:TonB family protein
MIGLLLLAALAAPCSHAPVPAHIVGATYGGRSPATGAMVYATVSSAGTVTSAKVLAGSGDPAFDKAAQEAMTSWRFVPAARGCVPVSGTATYMVGPGGATDFPDPCNHTSTNLAPVVPNYPAPVDAGEVETVVIVSLDALGNVTQATIPQSSGNNTMDAAAKSAAVDSFYFPAVKNCQPQTSTYTFKVTFVPR